MAEPRARQRRQLAVLLTLPAVVGLGVFLATLWLLVQGALVDIVPARVIGAIELAPARSAQWGAWWAASWPALAFAGAVVTVEAILGVALALALPRRGAWAWPGLVLLAWPLALPPATCELVQAELAPLLLAPLHLAEPWPAWTAAAIVDVWRFTPLVALVVHCAVRVPAIALHTADLDGLSTLQRQRHVNLPRVRGALAAVVVVRVVDVTLSVHLPVPFGGDVAKQLAEAGWRGGAALEVLAALGVAALFGGFTYWCVGRGRAGEAA